MLTMRMETSFLNEAEKYRPVATGATEQIVILREVARWRCGQSVFYGARAMDATTGACAPFAQNDRYE
jgi:hypothetical protein